MCAAYPLTVVDTIDVYTGELNERSALNMIVFGVSLSWYLLLVWGLFNLQRKEAHLDMIEGVVVDCLRAKWKAFIQARLPVTSYKPTSLLQSLFIQLPEAVCLLPSLPRPHCRCFWTSLHRDKSQENSLVYIFTQFEFGPIFFHVYYWHKSWILYPPLTSWWLRFPKPPSKPSLGSTSARLQDSAATRAPARSPPCRTPPSFPLTPSQRYKHLLHYLHIQYKQ